MENQIACSDIGEMVDLATLFDIGSSKRVFQSEWKETGIPFYRAREIVKLSTEGFVNNGIFIDENLYERYAQKYGVPKAGDIMITGVGTLGVCYIVKDNEKFYFKDGNIIWLRKKTDVNSQYVALVFTTPNLKKQIARTSSGSTVGTLTISNAEKLRIPLPPLSKQNFIVSIFDILTSVIEKRKQQIALLDEAETSLFIEMFGDPVANPMGWDIINLAEIGAFKNGMNFHLNEIGVEIYCLGVGDFGKKVNIKDTSTLPKITLAELPSSEYLLKNGDIVFVRSNGNKNLVGRCVAVYPNNTLTTFSGFCIRFRNSADNMITEFLLYLLKTDGIRKKLQGRGANIQNLNQQMLNKLEIPLPPISLQKEFVSRISFIEEYRTEMQTVLNQMEELKSALMQRYFG